MNRKKRRLHRHRQRALPPAEPGHRAVQAGNRHGEIREPDNFTPFPFLAPQTMVNSQGKTEFLFTVPDNAAFFRLLPQ